MDLLVRQFKTVALFAFAITLVFYAIYYLVFGRKKKLGVGKHAIQIIFVFYIAVILASVWSLTGAGEARDSNFLPFGSIVSVISTLGMTKGYPLGFAHIILNVCMFVPFGLILPIISKRCDSFLKVLGISFAFTLLIEIAQMILPMGRSFDIDDLICNTLGGAIGYCIYVLGKWIYGKAGKKQWLIPLKRVWLCLSILVLAITLPLGYYLQYHFSEYGHVYLNYENKPICSNIELNVELTETQNLMVYQLQPFDEKALMKELIEKFNMNAETYYQDERFYCCNDEGTGQHLAINIEWNHWSYHVCDNEVRQKLSSEKCIVLAKSYLEVLDFDKDLKLLEEDTTKHCVSFYKQDKDTTKYDGCLTVQVYNDSMNYSINNDIREFKQYKMISVCPIKAFEKIQKGQAAVVCKTDQIDKIAIYEVETEYFYEANKQLYIPVYCFKGLAYKDGNAYDINLLTKIIG